jgi:hypothetical protein
MRQSTASRTSFRNRSTDNAYRSSLASLLFPIGCSRQTRVRLLEPAVLERERIERHTTEPFARAYSFVIRAATALEAVQQGTSRFDIAFPTQRESAYSR